MRSEQLVWLPPDVEIDSPCILRALQMQIDVWLSVKRCQAARPCVLALPSSAFACVHLCVRFLQRTVHTYAHAKFQPNTLPVSLKYTQMLNMRMFAHRCIRIATIITVAKVEL